MFKDQITLRLCHTDATGFLFFPKQLELATQVLEKFLESRHFSLKELLSSPYLFPVVHMEADYKHPLKVGDELCISLQVQEIKESSVLFKYLFNKEGVGLVGEVLLVHVLVNRQTGQKHPLTAQLKELFLPRPDGNGVFESGKQGL